MFCKNLCLILFISTLLFSCKDNSSNPQNTNNESVTIGNQIWMKKNLDVDHYRNGDPIPEVKDSIEWANLKTGAWCYYNNDPELGKIYGKLYNTYAVIDKRGLAPEGWHIPTFNEIELLINNLGNKDLIGDKLKERDNIYWKKPISNHNNISGFSALPSGVRGDYAKFSYLGEQTWFYCCIFNEQYYVGAFALINLYSNLYFSKNNIYEAYHYGQSMRCIKD